MKDKNFKLTIEILKKNRINYWICHGTLLGIIRDDQLLPWDNDIDIGILENITNITALNILLSPFSYSPA
jgi:phosphorylcholine metabolism protein LicD